MDIMVDLETLGRRPGCAILSIGAVHFTKEGLGEEFYTVVSTPSCEMHGLHTDEETLAWWAKQATAARDVIAEAAASEVLLPEALSQFEIFLRTIGGKSAVRVWGNGSDFDNAILSVTYHAVGKPLPWEFWNNRCYRTLKGLRPAVKAPRAGTYHNALDDAKTQAAHAVELLKDIK